MGGLLLCHEKEQSTDIGYNVHEPWKYDAQRKKPDIRGQLDDYSYMRHPE